HHQYLHFSEIAVKGLDAPALPSVWLEGDATANTLTGNIGDDYLIGRDGDDILEGKEGNDTLVGGAGDDFLFGGDGDDDLDAGAGAGGFQYLYGEDGNDTYRYSKEDGKVFIDTRYERSDQGGADTVVFDDLNPEDFIIDHYEYSQVGIGKSVRLLWNDGSNSGELRIGLEGQTIESYQFADGTTFSSLTSEEFINRAKGLYLRGSEGDDTLVGLQGLDRLYGGDGDDDLDAGAGAGGFQYLYGEDGNDTYRYSKEDGKVFIGASTAETATSGTADRVVFSDLNLSDITIAYYDYGSASAHGNSVRLLWDDGTNSGELRIGQEGHYIEEFQFADGTIISSIDRDFASSIPVNLTDHYGEHFRVTQSNLYSAPFYADNVLDGDVETSSHTTNGSDEYLNIDFTNTLEVTSIQITNRAIVGDRLEGAVVSLRDATGNTVHTFDPIVGAENGEVFVFNLDAPVAANSVYIDGATGQYLHIAEVDVFGIQPANFIPTVNLTDLYGEHFRVTQSSLYSAPFYADNVLDGDVQTFSHTTNGADEYLNIDFTNTLEVTSIEITNREIGGDRLDGAVVSLRDAAGNTVHTFDPIVGAEDGEVLVFNLDAPIAANSVYIDGAAGEYLNIAEVDVFGVQPANFIPSVNLTDLYGEHFRATQSSTFSSDYEAENVLDNDGNSSAITSNGADEFFELDFTNDLEITQIELTNRNVAGDRLDGAVVSLRDASGTVVYESAPISGAENREVFSFVLSAPITARTLYVDGVDNQYLQIAEIDIIGREPAEFTVMPTADNDLLLATSDQDTINGLAGEDTIRFSTTADAGTVDQFDGGVGIDIADFSNFQSAVWVDLDHNGDEVWTRDAADLEASSGAWRIIANLDNIESVTGSAFDDLLSGDTSNNVLNGGAGTDTAAFAGNLANYDIDLQTDGGVTITDTVGTEGTDTLYGIELLKLGSSTYELGIGTTSDDVLNASASGDLLFSGDGNDTIAFSVTADAGWIDEFDGGAGIDTADFSSFQSAVWVDLSYNGADAWTRDGANVTSGTWRSIADFDGIESIVGSDFDDLLTGDSGDNVLEGGMGNDDLYGNAGADTFRFANVAFGSDKIEDFEDGTDLIDLSALDAQFSDLNIVQNGADTEITIGSNVDNKIIIANTNSGALGQEDFLLQQVPLELPDPGNTSSILANDAPIETIQLDNTGGFLPGEELVSLNPGNTGGGYLTGDVPIETIQLDNTGGYLPGEELVSLNPGNTGGGYLTGDAPIETIQLDNTGGYLPGEELVALNPGNTGGGYLTGDAPIETIQLDNTGGYLPGEELVSLNPGNTGGGYLTGDAPIETIQLDNTGGYLPGDYSALFANASSDTFSFEETDPDVGTDTEDALFGIDETVSEVQLSEAIGADAEIGIGNDADEAFAIANYGSGESSQEDFIL
ncbi:MAG: discoidin domain-containing protein, partial [Pseudomonadota bacterium]